METSLQQLALMLSRVPHLGPRAAYNVLTAEDQDTDILTASAEHLKKRYKMHAVAAEYLSANAPHLASESREMLDKVTDLGIEVMTVRDNRYPSTLKAYQTRLPPVIYAYGNLRLLQEKRFAVINSSSMSHRGSECTSDLSGFLVEEGLTAVTSHNNNPYQLVLLAAKRRNAPVVMVLDRGIINAFHGLMDWQPVAIARIWDPQFDPERDLVVSQFRLGDRWIGENSRLRDRMVFGLSDVVIACEVKEGGVMHNECRFAQDKGRELYVCSFGGDDDPPGNRNLHETGCQPLLVSEARSQLLSMCIAPMFEGRTDDLMAEDVINDQD